MYCAKCGTQLADGSVFCTNCGQQLQAAADPPSFVPPTQQPFPQGWETARPPVAYAGFWLRFFAYIIDNLVLGLCVGVGIFLPLLGSTLGTLSPWEVYTSMSRPFVAVRLLVLMVSWLYFASLESSAWQATLGKKALGLKVTDLAGNRISFPRASGRFFGKLLSGMLLFIGFLMAGFTERKQALHDILAGCLVIRKL